jgi:hypothetical protein
VHTGELVDVSRIYAAFDQEWARLGLAPRYGYVYVQTVPELRIMLVRKAGVACDEAIRSRDGRDRHHGDCDRAGMGKWGMWNAMEGPQYMAL